MKQFHFSTENQSGGTTIPRQKRALRTRETLLAAVETIVAAEGTDAVTTTRIAAATGVSVGTIYRYFDDRDALLLAAYDATVTRIVAACGAALADLDPRLAVADAARKLLGLYLDTADSIPAHSGLLAAMRAIRPVAADQGGNNEITIVGDLLRPFLQKFAGGTAMDPTRLHFINVLMGTLVDLYLVTADPGERLRLRGEIEAHMLLALDRAISR